MGWMSWGVKTICFKGSGVSLGGSGVSIGGVRSLRVFNIIISLLTAAVLAQTLQK